MPSKAFIPAVRCSRSDACAWLSVPVHSIPEVIVADERIFGLGSRSLNLTGFEDYKTSLLGFHLQKHVEVKSRGLGGMERYRTGVERPWPGREIVGPSCFYSLQEKVLHRIALD